MIIIKGNQTLKHFGLLSYICKLLCFQIPIGVLQEEDNGGDTIPDRDGYEEPEADVQSTPTQVTYTGDTTLHRDGYEEPEADVQSTPTQVTYTGDTTLHRDGYEVPGADVQNTPTQLTYTGGTTLYGFIDRS